MTPLETIQKVGELLGRFAHEVKVVNAMGQYDINRMAEDFLVPVLSEVFDAPNLQNQNRLKMNYPAVDLGCTTKKLSIQVTSDPSSAKVIETLNKFDKHKLQNQYDKLYVFVITEKQSTYRSKRLNDICSRSSIKFDPCNDIIDYRDVATMISSFDTTDNAKILRIHHHLLTAFSKQDVNLQFRNDLDKFLEVSRLKIENEKRTKKYIPSVFMETTKTKEDMRYFANPMFFYRKIDQQIKKIPIADLNKNFILAKLDPIQVDLEHVANSEEPQGFDELLKRIQKQNESLKEARDLVMPFSWYAEKTQRFTPDEFKVGYWDVFRHTIQSSSSGIDNILKDISSNIKLIQSKVFLITSMAGQGKTNFVCDLIENQFQAFSIPSIFIPARALNDYPGPARIFAYVKNNRYAPIAADLHAMLKLFDDVAKENKKPFVIAIDGINEVGPLDDFCGELRVFLEAVCQYNFVKLLVTCRIEFFEHKFKNVFDNLPPHVLYHVPDLRAKMSDSKNELLLKAYLEHFSIKSNMSVSSENFLKSDMILLRIFCEIHEGQNIGHVSDIYKGDVFEAYLIKKIKEFPSHQQNAMLKAIYKICSGMLEAEDFSQISVAKFNTEERNFIEQLIGEDIILRREVPSSGLSSLGIENISFTYDELRDFLLAYFVTSELFATNPTKINEIFARIQDWPIYEGFFRYAYVLARKNDIKPILTLCESSDKFLIHYVNNLHLLPAASQNRQDVKKVKAILVNIEESERIKTISWLLFKKRNLDEPLNIQLLIDHLHTLSDSDCRNFLCCIFSTRVHFNNAEWNERLNKLVSEFLDLSDQKKSTLIVPVLEFTLYLISFADWEQREAAQNYFEQQKGYVNFEQALNNVKVSVSVKIQNCTNQIEASMKNS